MHGNIINQLKENLFEANIMKDGFVERIYEANTSGLLMLSIPYDKGWQVEVNGEKVDYRKVWDSMSAIPIEAGKSEILLEYKTPFLKPGVFCLILETMFLMFLGLYFTKGNILKLEDSWLAFENAN